MSESHSGENHQNWGKHIVHSGSFKKGHVGYKGMLGRKHTEEAKRKVSMGNKGKKRTDECKRNLGNRIKGDNNPMKRIDIRKKLSEANKGEKSWNWKGGITPETLKIRRSIENRLWREAVFARDNFTCQKCGDKKGGNFNAHHIQNFSRWLELRFAIDNGITFCKNCHKEFHHIYGKTNNNKEQVIEFLTK